MSPAEPAGHMPRFERVDRFPSSCSALSALNQLAALGVDDADLRLVLRDRRRETGPQVVAQAPEPGAALRYGREVTLDLAVRSFLDGFPEGLFVSQPGAEGREQLDAARRLFAPLDKTVLLACARLRSWNAVFSGARDDDAFTAFLFDLLGLDAAARRRALRLFNRQELTAWLRILPLLDGIVGRPACIAEILALFLKDPVDVVVADDAPQDLPGRLRFRLGALRKRHEGARGQGANILGRIHLGTESAVRGSTATIAVGPLDQAGLDRYAGFPFTPVVDGRGAGILVDLGPVCELGCLWRDGEGDAAGDGGDAAAPRADLSQLDDTRWPRLCYLLPFLLPAHHRVRVRLAPPAAGGWRLGAAATAAGETEGGEADAGEAAAVAGGEFRPSTLGVRTVLSDDAAD